MSIEQSKRILEAAGALCVCGDPVMDTEYLDSCGNCGKPMEWEDLSLPENRHLLIGCVEKICGTSPAKWRRFAIALTEGLGLDYTEMGVTRLFNLTAIGVVATASNEAIMTALLRVIEEEA